MDALIAIGTWLLSDVPWFIWAACGIIVVVQMGAGLEQAREWKAVEADRRLRLREAAEERKSVREAEAAVIALAAERRAEWQKREAAASKRVACAYCGTVSESGGQRCRNCGAPASA
jgi:hypothetical protein